MSREKQAMSGNCESNYEETDEFERFEIEKPQAEEAATTAAQCGPSTHGPDLRTIADVSNLSDGTEVSFYATIHTLQSLSPTLEILDFRDRTGSIQGTLSGTALNMKKSFQLSPESFVEVSGTLQKPLVSNFGVKLAVYSISPLHEIYDDPDFSLEKISMRILDLRMPFNKALFRIRSMVLRTFRKVLEGREFIEIHTPKLQPAATELSAATFEVDYYGRRASLAQSSQLANQLALEGGFERVYEIGPVFDAKVSKIHDCFAENTTVDVGMIFDRSYHELIQTVDGMLKSVFAAKQAIPEVRVVRERWPSKDIVWLGETPIISSAEALHMLQTEGLSIPKDQSAVRDDVRLGALIKDKYMTDYFILDEVSASEKPCYVEKAEGRRWKELFSVFVRGRKICTGKQWIHNTEELRYTMRQAPATEVDNECEPSGFNLSSPSHGGASLCLEHFLEVVLELDDIAYSSLLHSVNR